MQLGDAVNRCYCFLEPGRNCNLPVYASGFGLVAVPSFLSEFDFGLLGFRFEEHFHL